MAVVPSCAPPYHSYTKNQSLSSHHLPSVSSSSLSSHSSQPSLASSLSSSLTLLIDHLPSTYYHSISTLQGHSSYVFSLILVGKRLYSGSHDNQIRAWSRDPVTGHHIGPGGNVMATGDHGAVKSLVVSGDRLFAAQQDCKIRVWKIADGDETHDPKPRKYHQIATLPTLNDRFSKLFLAKNYVQVRRHKTTTWLHHVDTVSALALSRDGTLLYSASWDRSFKVWDTSNFKCLESVARAHDDAINALVVSVDGYVYTGSADMKIKVWKKHQGKNKKVKKKHSLVATLENHKSGVNALVLSNDGQVLYSGACDRSILVWEKDDPDTKGGHMTSAGTLIGHTKSILCLTVVSDLLVSGSADNTVRMWRKELNKSYACFAVLEGHTRPVKCLSAATDGSEDEGNKAGPGTYCLVYSGSLDHNIRVWKVWVPLL